MILVRMRRRLGHGEVDEETGWQPREMVQAVGFQPERSTALMRYTSHAARITLAAR